MKVLILTSSNPYKIAGVVAKDLLESLQRSKEIEVKLVVREYDKYIEKNIVSVNSRFDHFLKRVYKRFNNLLWKLKLRRKNSFETDENYSVQVYDQSKEYYKSEKILKKSKFIPDLVIVLFMQNFLNFKNLYELNKITGAPIYLYLMDMAAFTGGCHYAWDCKNYFANCGTCPGLFSKDPFDQTYLNWQYKKRYIDKMHLEVITCSQELKNQVLNASLFRGKQLHHDFYLPINEEIFKPAEKIVIRNSLNIPNNKKIIFFGANRITNQRKGFNELIKSLRILYSQISDEDRNNIHLLIAGDIEQDVLKSIPFGYTFLGFLTHADLPKAFQAADIFASPSIEDSGPMMINQSLMCGTPVVAFGVGVALDFVHTGKTGYLVKNKDCKDFARGLLFFLELNNEEAKKINNECRELAIKKYSIDSVSEKWINLLK